MKMNQSKENRNGCKEQTEKEKNVEECEDRWYSKSDETSYCCSIDGICRALKPGDGCSCGRRKE